MLIQLCWQNTWSSCSSEYSLNQWKQYSLILETSVDRLKYQSPFAPPTVRQGRPRFDVNRVQLEYLLSLSFNWSEILNLLAISRMTLYR